MRPRTFIPLDAALALMTARVRPVPARRMALDDAANAVLAEAVASLSDQPTTAIALADGWAVSAAHLSGADPYAPMPLSPTPAFVEIGDPMPEGCDAVLPFEAVTVIGPFAQATADLAPGRGVLPAGGHARAGAILGEAGARIGPGLIAALRSARVEGVQARRARIHVITTGGHGLGRPDTTGALISAMIEGHCGANVEHDAADGPEDLARLLASCAADAVFVVGGTGEGPSDQSAAAFADGGELVFHGVGLVPGETSGFGLHAGRPMLLLPGRPDAAFAAFLVLGRPLLDALGEAKRTIQSVRPARLARKVVSAPGMAEIRFVRLRGAVAEPLAGPALPLGLLGSIDGYLFLPPESEGHPEGAEVAVHLVPAAW